MTSPWLLLALCCILGTLTSAIPTEQPNSQADDVIVDQVPSSKGAESERPEQVEDETRELQDQMESIPPQALSMEHRVSQYERAALNMADEDLFPVVLCEEAALNRMHRALFVIPHDALLRTLLMVTMMQSEGCREGALHTATKLRELIKSAASQHPHDVMAENDDVTTKQGQAPSPDSDEDKVGQGGQTARDHCSAVDECRWRGVADVRTIMADETDLLLLYDTVAAAVFHASGRTSLARALGRDLLQDLSEQQHKLLHPRFRRFISSEADVQYWIGWIPVPYVSAAYNGATAVYYGSQGDYDLAASRSVSLALDFAVPPSLRRITNHIANQWLRWSTETVARKGVEYGTGGYK